MKSLVGVNKMKKTEVSRIILERIDKSNDENNVKSLVKWVLEWEKERFNETKARYYDEFIKMIDKIIDRGPE